MQQSFERHRQQFDGFPLVLYNWKNHYKYFYYKIWVICLEWTDLSGVDSAVYTLAPWGSFSNITKFTILALYPLWKCASWKFTQLKGTIIYIDSLQQITRKTQVFNKSGSRIKLIKLSKIGPEMAKIWGFPGKTGNSPGVSGCRGFLNFQDRSRSGWDISNKHFHEKT